MANLLRISRPKRRSEDRRLVEPRLDDLALLEALPCVVYEADEKFKIISISSSAKPLLGIEPQTLVASTWLCGERVAFPDREFVQTQLGKLRTEPSVWLIHRMIDDHGVLIRVGHSIRSRLDGSTRRFRGCLIPIHDEGLDRAGIEIDVVSKFIHKIGNHFQLLNLMLDSIRRNGASPKNMDALQQTTETAIGLTRGFANLLQYSLAASRIDVAELVESTIDSKKDLGSEKGVDIEFRKHGTNDNIMCGDAMLLELALAAVIDNAIDASPQGGAIRIDLCCRSAADSDFGLNVATVRVVDHGPGMSEHEVSQSLQPFYTTKPGHEGMGLSVASRYVELHGGRVRMSSVEGEGTQVEIILPLAELSQQLKGDAALD